ncbi:MAG: hypothetical protein BEN19_05720 [Epulopiscium sp. Nuni2H_MBin003]|nr:MAG: hypothetical protein BEN19_05720 [Epulopiscium sp. Nuni2H_MBin003]
MKIRDLTTGGALVALTMLIFYAITVVPTNTLTLLTISSFMPILAYLRTTLKTAILVYICNSILGFILFTPILGISYLIFFGAYGIIKAFIEAIDNIVLENILKLIYFIGALVGLNFMVSIRTIIPMFDIMPSMIFPLVAVVAFFVYDFALSLLIEGYYKYKP